MAKRLWTIFRETKQDATIDVHHGDSLASSPITDHMLCFPFIDSLWHGEGFDYDRFNPWEWLVEISGLPFNVPSETLGGDDWFGRAMLFGIWSRAGWCAGTEKQRKLWKFFDEFGIEEALMTGWWAKPSVVLLNKPETYATVFTHPQNGVLLVIASWHQKIAEWMHQPLDTTVHLNRKTLGLSDGKLKAVDIMSGKKVDLSKPVPLPDPRDGRIIWIKK